MSKSILVNGKVNGKATGFNALTTLQSIIDWYKITDKKALEELKMVSTDTNLAKFARTSTSLVYPKVDEVKVEDRLVRVVGCVTGTSYNGDGGDDFWKVVGLISQFFRCDKHGVWQAAPESSLYASGSNFEKVRTYDYKKICSLCDILNGLDEFSEEACPFKVGDKKRTIEERVFWILKNMDKTVYSYLKHLVYDAVTCCASHAKEIVEQDTTFKCAFDTSARSAYCSSDPAKAYEYSSRTVFSNSFFKSHYFFGSVMKSRDKRTLEACLNIQSIVKYAGVKKGVVRVYGVQCNMTKLVRALTYAYRDNKIRFELEGNSDNFGNCSAIPYAKEKCVMIINCKIYSPPKRGNINLINAHYLFAADLKKYNSESDRVFSLVSAIHQLNTVEKCVPTFVPESGEAFMSLSESVGLDQKERSKLFTKACYLSNTSGVDLIPAFFKLRAFYNVHDCEMPEIVSAGKNDVYEFIDVSVDKDYSDVFSKSNSPAQIIETVVENKLKIEVSKSVSTTDSTSIKESKKAVEEKAVLVPVLDQTGYIVIRGGTGTELAVSKTIGLAQIGDFTFEIGPNGFKLTDGFLESVGGAGGELTKNKSGVYFVKYPKGRVKEERMSTSISGSFDGDVSNENSDES